MKKDQYKKPKPLKAEDLKPGMFVFYEPDSLMLMTEFNSFESMIGSVNTKSVILIDGDDLYHCDLSLKFYRDTKKSNDDIDMIHIAKVGDAGTELFQTQEEAILFALYREKEYADRTLAWWKLAHELP